MELDPFVFPLYSWINFCTIFSYSLDYVIARGYWKRKVYNVHYKNSVISDGHVGNNVAHNASCCKQCGLLKTTHVQLIWPMQAMKVTKTGTKQIFAMLGIK